MAKQNFGGVYALMDFPPYQYREYPKAIQVGQRGEFKIAQNEEEESKIRSAIVAKIDSLPAENQAAAIAADPVRESLILRANELNVPINRKWSIGKLQAVVKDAEEAIDNLAPDDNLPANENADGALSDGSEEIHSEDDKEVLIAKAKSLGIPANKLWGVPKLKRTIEEVEASKK